MKEELRKDLYKQAVDLWGIEFQDNILIEECSELITAISHSKRKNKVISNDEIAGELTDVILLTEQYIQNHNLEEKVAEAKERKLEKLRRYIGNERCIKMAKVKDEI